MDILKYKATIKKYLEPNGLKSRVHLSKDSSQFLYMGITRNN